MTNKTSRMFFDLDFDCGMCTGCYIESYFWPSWLTPCHATLATPRVLTYRRHTFNRGEKYLTGDLNKIPPPRKVDCVHSVFTRTVFCARSFFIFIPFTHVRSHTFRALRRVRPDVHVRKLSSENRLHCLLRPRAVREDAIKMSKWIIIKVFTLRIRVHAATASRTNYGDGRRDPFTRYRVRVPSSSGIV